MNEPIARLHSQDAEQALLGALLLNPAKADDLHGLRPEHCYSDAHRLILSCLLAMLTRGQPVDAVTVAEALHESGQDEATGGLAYLGGLAANSAGGNVRHYADIVLGKAMERQLLGASETIRATVMGAGTTLDKLATSQAAVMAITERVETQKPRDLRDVLVDSVTILEQRGTGEVLGIPTGFDAIDDNLAGGMRGGNMIVIAGRPGMGKTALAINIARYVAKQGKTSAVFSMEMSDTELADRLIAQEGSVSLDDVIRGNLEGESGDRIMSAVGRLHSLPMVIDEQGGLSMFELASKVRGVRRRNKDLGLVVIDYLQLMCGSDEENRVQEVSNISRGIKALAKELDIPIIALSQLNRGLEQRQNKRPVMSDLRESGAIEQDADVILFVYRDEEYNPDSPDKGTAEVIFGKNRQGKKGVVARLAFQGEYARFVPLAHDWQPEPRAEHKPLRRRGGHDF